MHTEQNKSGVGMINVRDYGAKGDGAAKDHSAIQRAIDSCAGQGGGTVWVPPGNYVCGTIELKSNIRLFLDAGAVIAGSPKPTDYRRLPGNDTGPAGYHQNLIVAWKATDVGVCGSGLVDARGHYFYDTNKVIDSGRRMSYPLKHWRPGPTIAFFSCSRFGLEGITIRDNPHYAVYLNGCNSGRMAGLRIITDRKFENGDGIHADCSRALTISGCHIDSEDDSLCFYTDNYRTREFEPVASDITVSDCVLGSDCCAIRIGYTGEGRVGNMVFSNIVVSDANRGIDFICTARPGATGKQGLPAGPKIHDILFSNFVIDNANWGITANVSNDTRAPAGIRDILFSSMKVRSRRGNYLVGSTEIPVRDIVFRDADFTVTGKLAGTAREIPDPIDVFGMPAIPHGLLLRHAERVRFLNSRIRWDGAEGAWRSGLHVVDGRQIDARDLRVDRWRADWTSGITSTGSLLL